MQKDNRDEHKVFEGSPLVFVSLSLAAPTGKTTILQRVCNTTELPKIFNRKGDKVFHFLDTIT